MKNALLIADLKPVHSFFTAKGLPQDEKKTPTTLNVSLAFEEYFVLLKRLFQILKTLHVNNKAIFYIALFQTLVSLVNVLN